MHTKEQIETQLELILRREGAGELIEEEQDFESEGIYFEHVDTYRENDEFHVVYFIHDTNLHIRLTTDHDLPDWEDTHYAFVERKQVTEYRWV